MFQTWCFWTFRRILLLLGFWLLTALFFLVHLLFVFLHLYSQSKILRKFWKLWGTCCNKYIYFLSILNSLIFEFLSVRYLNVSDFIIMVINPKILLQHSRTFCKMHQNLQISPMLFSETFCSFLAMKSMALAHFSISGIKKWFALAKYVTANFSERVLLKPKGRPTRRCLTHDSIRAKTSQCCICIGQMLIAVRTQISLTIKPPE